MRQEVLWYASTTQGTDFNIPILYLASATVVPAGQYNKILSTTSTAQYSSTSSTVVLPGQGQVTHSTGIPGIDSKLLVWCVPGTVVPFPSVFLGFFSGFFPPFRFAIRSWRLKEVRVPSHQNQSYHVLRNAQENHHESKKWSLAI